MYTYHHLATVGHTICSIVVALIQRLSHRRSQRGYTRYATAYPERKENKYCKYKYIIIVLKIKHFRSKLFKIKIQV